MIVSQEQCINDFVRYQKKEKIFNKEGKLIGTDIETINGIYV